MRSERTTGRCSRQKNVGVQQNALNRTKRWRSTASAEINHTKCVQEARAECEATKSQKKEIKTHHEETS